MYTDLGCIQCVCGGGGGWGVIGGCSLLARCTGVHRPGLYTVCVWGGGG